MFLRSCRHKELSNFDELLLSSHIINILKILAIIFLYTVANRFAIHTRERIGKSKILALFVIVCFVHTIQRDEFSECCDEHRQIKFIDFLYIWSNVLKTLKTLTIEVNC